MPLSGYWRIACLKIVLLRYRYDDDFDDDDNNNHKDENNQENQSYW